MQVFGDLSAWQWVGVSAAAVLVGLSKAGFGAGAGILAVPLMTAVLGPAGMLPVMLLVLITGDVFSIVHYPDKCDGRNLAMLVPGLLGGVLAGSVALGWFLGLPAGDLWMRRLVGLLSVAFVGVQLYRIDRERRLGLVDGVYRPRIWHGVGLGTCAGFTSTLAHAGGPLVALFLLPQKLEKGVFVGTVVRYFLVGNVVKLAPYLWKGLFTLDRLALAGALVPCVVAGTLVGVYLHRRFSDKGFRLLVYTLALCVGAYLLSGWKPGGGPQEAGLDARDRFQMGVAAYRQGDYDAAVSAFEAASTDAPDLAEARFNWGLALYGARRYALAERTVAGAAAGDDALVDARAEFNLGNCAYRRGAFDRAERLYSAVAERCRAGLATPLTKGEGGLPGELLRRAEHNLRCSRRRLAREAIGRADSDAGSPRVSDGSPEAAPAQDGTARAALPPSEVTGVAGSRVSGETGRRTVERILADVASRDTGPVLRDRGAGPAATGPDW